MTPNPTAAPPPLLTSVVAVARSVFGAAASSVMLLDEDAGELVFAAVAGQGSDTLIGRRFPADRGIAGWVAATGEAMIVDQVSASAVFARDVAESTGYVPESIMAAQIAHDGDCLGVLEVLDCRRPSAASFGDLDLLILLAEQASLALRDRAEGGRDGDRKGREERLAVADLIRQVQSWDPPARHAASQVLQALVGYFGGAAS
jgi:GAF domain-containing protein